MTNLVKIRGLDLNSAQAGTATSSFVPRGFRIPSALGQYSDTGAKASATVGASNAAVTYTAVYGGTYGNSIKVQNVVTGDNTPFSVSVTYASGTANPTIVVTSATDGSGVATTTAAVAAAAVNADPVANTLVSASLPGTGATILAAVSATSLTGGSDTGLNFTMYQRVTNGVTVVVDTDNLYVARVLARNPGRWISLGPA